MPRVTKKLRETWGWQLEQMIEEREYTQTGRKRSAEDITIVDHEIRIQKRLLELPLGTQFDARDFD